MRLETFAGFDVGLLRWTLGSDLSNVGVGPEYVSDLKIEYLNIGP